MNPQPQKHHFIVVHFGDPKVTTTCLASLLPNMQNIGHIIVVDNAPKPYKLPLTNNKITVIRPKENRGYGAGGALGLGALAGKSIQPYDVVFIMNNDITLDRNFITHFQKQQVIPEVIYSPQAGEVNLINGRATLAPKGTNSARKKWYTLPYADGAYMAATFATWAKLKGMPTEFFLYWEDVALSITAQKKNIQLVITSGVTITHTRDQRLNPSAQELYYLVRNGAYVLAHATPWPWQIYWRLRNAARFIYHRYLSSSPQVAQALRDAIHGKLGKK
jgi:GT2 family glycosyltransferase